MPSSSSSSSPLLSAVASLPTKPGVYIYKNAKGDIIYVGKAKSLRDRVKSYFQPPTRLGPKTVQLVENIATLEHIEVGSEVEALLLESQLIRKFKPHYNIDLKDDKSPYYIHVSKETFPRPIINHTSQKSVAGPFLNRYTPTRILKLFRRIAPYCLAPRPVKKPCFYSHLGLCNPCPGQANFDPQLYQKNITRLKYLLTGNFSRVKSDLSSQMTKHSKGQDYELAATTRDHLNALAFLTTTPTLPDEYLTNPNLVQDTRNEAVHALQTALSLSSLHRIELYDNAHLMGTNPTSAMVVAIDGEITPKNYRHFTIRTKKSNSDVDMMAEVLGRRLKRKDWPMPDLIVLDGGLPQLSIVNSQLSIPVIALAKRDEIIYTTDKKEIKLSKDHPGLRLLMRLRDEAHRFSRRLHHKHRAKLN